LIAKYAAQDQSGFRSVCRHSWTPPESLLLHSFTRLLPAPHAIGASGAVVPDWFIGSVRTPIFGNGPSRHPIVLLCGRPAHAVDWARCHRRVFQLHAAESTGRTAGERRVSNAAESARAEPGFCPRNCAADSQRTTAHSTQAARKQRRLAGPGVSPRLLMYLKVAPAVR
jgi:hypothetical protein